MCVHEIADEKIVCMQNIMRGDEMIGIPCSIIIDGSVARTAQHAEPVSYAAQRHGKPSNHGSSFCCHSGFL